MLRSSRKLGLVSKPLLQQVKSLPVPKICGKCTAETTTFTKSQRRDFYKNEIVFTKQKTNMYTSNTTVSQARRQLLKDMKVEIDMSRYPQELVRNFCIIAHIDHGKSTLADRLLQETGTIQGKEVRPQFLDKLQVERERGITVKAQTCSMFYTDKRTGKTYLMNLIDTPGHVDFNYEVSRSMSACDAALLLVDSGQGIQAQTLANYYLALEQNLEIIPIITKIDQQHSQPEATTAEMVSAFGVEKESIIPISAKTGLNCDKVLPAIIDIAPPPKGDINKPLKALIFDSWYDGFYGVICLIQVIDGKINTGDQVYLAYSKKTYEVQSVGLMHPELTPTDQLLSGQVGYLILGMKSTKEARIGDTVCLANNIVEPLPGFKAAKPMVFAGIYPIEQGEYARLRDAIDKLLLNDSSVSYSQESSIALGMGLRCGFLGLLHMDVFQQRLQQEYGTDVIITPPTNTFKLEKMKDKSQLTIENPNDFPNSTSDYNVFEPMVKATIIAPNEYMQDINTLCQGKRGEQVNVDFSPDGRRVILIYKLPLNEIIHEFFDQLKSLSHGYATLEYEQIGYETSDLVKVSVLINSKPVDAMSFIVHRSRAYPKAKEIVERLKTVISRQLFEVRIQAAIGENKIIASERLSAYRKDVTAKCYGGDFSRKRKLLEKQKEGKKKMKQIGEVNVPHDAFIRVFSDAKITSSNDDDNEY